MKSTTLRRLATTVTNLIAEGQTEAVARLMTHGQSTAQKIYRSDKKRGQVSSQNFILFIAQYSYNILRCHWPSEPSEVIINVLSLDGTCYEAPDLRV